ncbi:glycoside hydrolase family 25 protein [Myroides sp. M-43]|uniref:glycoside hydrolase family 25 protein n=1 Tax=Myroides oncorhynchi TaxID=2893756 RepID=UPI001E5522C5|nr:glycoside hydrolase family 25 protein [Myroides oncorhynchi]MCC9042499.1 glycoside hydrolase family 25 protein [Myroides oncorhynchi]
MASNKSNSNPMSAVGARPKRKTPIKRKPTKKNEGNTNTWNQIKWVVIITFFVGIGIWFGISFKEGIRYFFNGDSKIEGKSLFDVRTVEVLNRHNDMLVGFDVSHYQGVIDWKVVDSVAGKASLDFVFIRATMGKDGRDKAFKLNWKGARANHFIRGAYHYYRPDENSTEQAENFIKNVKISEGDFPPVLDIEDMPKEQSMENLRKGLQNWIKLVETHYKVKPILYSGENFYTHHLKEWFPDYVLWIANYNFFVEEIKPEWHFWQFTEKGIIEGIDGKVDLNIYNGSKADIRDLLVP